MCKSSVKDQIIKITDAVKRTVNTTVVVISGRKFRKSRQVPPSRLQ